MRVSLMLCLLVVSPIAAAGGATCSDLQVSYDDDGSTRATVPCNKNCETAPGWDGKTGEPPLSIGKAISAAQIWARRKHGADVEVNTVSLMRYHCGEELKWDYWVHLGPPASSDSVVVLMDGTVVEKKEVAKKAK